MINRKKIELEKKEKRDRELKLMLMKCDICYLSHFNEVFILRSHRFALRTPKHIKKAHRVCGGCAKWLFKNRYYNFGTSWREVFFYQMGNSKINREKYNKNREKYMVIHA